MKKMNRFFAMLLALAMLFALAACGTQPAAVNPPEEKQPDSPETAPETTPEEKQEGAINTLAAPVFPEKTEWTEISRSGLDAFVAASLPQLFAGLNGQNRVYSPLNVYMALGMLAEVTDGETRQQLLDAMGCRDIEALRGEIKTLWEASYRDSDELVSLPAASLWLRDDMNYRPGALQNLADFFYASAFSGPMGTDAYSQQLRDWINERTNHLLEQQADGLSLDADTMLALVTTLYFKGCWADQFSEELTMQDDFYADGGTVKADFMRRSDAMNYYRGAHFAAVRLPMYGGAGMWLLLPDEGYTLQELAESEEAVSFLLSNGDWEDCRRYQVNLSVPRFDVSSDLDLTAILPKLGIIDVFDGDHSDFSPLTDEQLAVSDVEHAARVKIDEEGCEAAAFTTIMVKSAAFEPLEEINFVLNRPFFFAVTGDQGQLLFTGAVNTPAE